MKSEIRLSLLALLGRAALQSCRHEAPAIAIPPPRNSQVPQKGAPAPAGHRAGLPRLREQSRTTRHAEKQDPEVTT